MILSLWTEFCWPVLLVNVTTAQSDLGNFKCHIQSALSPQSITAWSTDILFAGPSAEVILNRWNTVQVSDTKQKERVKKEKGARGIRGGGGETVLDPVVSARGTHFVGIQGVLSDGRMAKAVFRNTSRPVYCLGAWVSTLSSPPHCSK